ncbi:MAG: M48 family metallopeptidase [Candidatus Colwellbacteria bacterium]|nr:M48 family metallopeptidase [Candidatus Colwellbacteria bacterium]
MTSLYTHKSENIRKTWILFSAFLIIVIGLGWTFSQAYGDPSILWIAVIFSTLMSVVSFWYSDRIVLKMAGAKPIEKKDNPELYRIVENLAITAGLPTPRIYVVPERALNAFATGRDANHAVVAVTDGLLEKLDKTELEGVLAHELSHIGNRDMLVSTVAVILVGFMSILADIFLRSMFWGGGRRDRNGGGFMILVGLILSFVAPLTATLIQLAISRSREFLADSSGALLTRYPEGLASALQKISADTTSMQRANTATAHLWLDNPFKASKGKVNWLTKLFMTHPPIQERIKALKVMSV